MPQAHISHCQEGLNSKNLHSPSPSRIKTSVEKRPWPQPQPTTPSVAVRSEAHSRDGRRVVWYLGSFAYQLRALCLLRDRWDLLVQASRGQLLKISHREGKSAHRDGCGLSRRRCGDSSRTYHNQDICLLRHLGFPASSSPEQLKILPHHEQDSNKETKRIIIPMPISRPL